MNYHVQKRATTRGTDNSKDDTVTLQYLTDNFQKSKLRNSKAVMLPAKHSYYLGGRRGEGREKEQVLTLLMNSYFFNSHGINRMPLKSQS